MKGVLVAGARYVPNRQFLSIPISQRTLSIMLPKSRVFKLQGKSLAVVAPQKSRISAFPAFGYESSHFSIPFLYSDRFSGALDFGPESFAEFLGGEAVVMAEVVNERGPLGRVDVASVKNEMAGGMDAKDFNFHGDGSADSLEFFAS